MVTPELQKLRLGPKMLYMDAGDMRDAINKAVGDELRGLRARKNLSRPELAKLTGISRPTIQRFEIGERSPDMQQLARLLSVLGISMREFVDRALRDVDGIE